MYDRDSRWGSMLLLTSKSHQEICTDIKDIVWRLYVSYRLLNSITRTLEFLIPRCTDTIEGFGDSNCHLYLSRLMLDMDTIKFKFAQVTKKV